MADPAQADDPNPFTQLNSDQPVGGTQTPAPKPQVNPFDKFNSDQEAPPESGSSTVGAFTRGVVRGAAPALGSLPAIGAGAEIGGAIGSLGGPLAPVTVPVGALVGGTAAAFGASSLIDRVQNWALSKLPDSWREKIGMDDRQEQLDEAEHPGAAFLGGLVPFALTMRPGATPTTKLPENATALQRILSHPVTARVFGGAAMGGMELGQEATEDDHISWPKAAIATGFGMVFNRPTRIGESLTEIGARPARALVGRPEPTPAPTVAQAGDAKVLGPGVTEQVFQGAHEQDPTAAMTAQESARAEQAVLGPTPTPDIHETARRMAPELFAHYDDLLERQKVLSGWIEEQGTEVAPVAQKHLAETNTAIDAIAPEISATYRRAAEATGAPTTRETPRYVSMAEMLASQGEESARTEAVPTTSESVAAPEQTQPNAEQPANRPIPIAEQRDYIRSDVARQLVAAGRSPEEAQAAGALVAARYETRAARFNGAIGTAQELYDRESARIVGGKRPPEATPTTAAPATPPPEAPAAAKVEPAAAEPEPEAVSAAAPARRGRNPDTLSLLEFAARNGGIRNDDKLISDLRQSIGKDNKFIPGFGQLIRNPQALSTAAKRGGAQRPMSLDEFRALAVAHGYLEDHGEISHGVTESTINDLLDAMDKELRGDRVYRIGYMPKERAVEPGEFENERHSFIQSLNRFVSENGASELTEAEQSRAIELWQKEGLNENADILERLALEADDRDTEHGAPERDHEVEGWDTAHEPEGTQGAGEAVEEARPGEQGGGVARTGGEGDREAGESVKKPLLPGGSTLEKAASWILRNKTTKEVVMETFDPKKVEHLNTNKYEAVPIAEYLGELNKTIHQGESAGATEAQHGAAEDAQEVIEYFQRKSRNLIADREAEGQLGLLGTERISQAEQAQRKADEPLKPSVEQKPMDVGLFGTEKDQRDLFQGVAQGKIRMSLPIGRTGERPILTLMRNADASTAIHELGHAWLGELMRDSVHPQAPEDLKGDAKTVLNWLGADNAQAIKVRQHEKFARGFEQYLREGVAPSPELAGVFAKFRNWLLQIYQTIRGLGPQISPDIRQVFDRMLASEPQRTVIAPERVKAPTLADIHEADAAHTEAHEAEPVGDRTLAETEQLIQNLPPRITDASERLQAEAKAATEPPGEATAGPGQPGPLEPGGGGPEPVPSGGGTDTQRGPELQGGGGPVREGSGQPGSGERSGEPGNADAILGDKPLAPRPATLIGAEESPFVDKAGNIRRENLNAPDDMWAAIKASAESNNDFIGDRRGVVTDGQVSELANDIGMVGAEKIVAERVKGQALNAEQLVALSRLVKQQASEVGRLSQLAKGQPTEENTLKFATEQARLDMILRTFAGATAEAGRALRAFQNMKGDIEAAAREAGTTLFQIRREMTMASSLDTPQKIAKFAQDKEKRTFGRMILEYWINGLISGPATHATYMIGNEILALEKAGPETAAAATIGALRKSLGRRGDTVRLGEVAEQLRTHVTAVPSALKAALDAFRTGVTTALPGEVETNLLPFQPGTELATPAVLDEAAKFSDAMESGYSIMRGIKDGIMAGGELARAAGVEPPNVGLRYTTQGAIPDIEIHGVNALPLGTIARLPSRFVASIHSFFRALNYSMEKNRIAYRTAANEGLTGTAFDQRVGDIRQNPDESIMEAARGEATQLTLMGQGGEFTKALSRLTNAPIFGFPVFKFIDPFVHISANIIEQSIIERTPLGILSPEIRADLMGKNGNIAADTAAARMLMGTVYAIGLGGLAASGVVSGSGPSDPRQAAMWRLAGNQSHSVRVGDMWYDVHRLGPLGMLMGVAADMYDVSHAASQGDILLAASNLQHAITQNILDESFMRGPSDLIKAIDDPGRYGEAYIRNFLSSFVPFSVGMAQMARASDPYSRQARSVMDEIKAKIPGMSESLLPRRDIWGEEMPSRDALLAAGVTAIYETRMSRDPVNLALVQLGIAPANLERKIRNVQLTDDQYDDFQRIAGRMTKMRLDAIVNSPDFRYWPNHIRRDVITEVITQSREAGRNVMMMKNPTIAREATQMQLDRKLKD